MAVTLKPGFFLSNEPGFYKKDDFGVRLENILEVVTTNISVGIFFYIFLHVLFYFIILFHCYYFIVSIENNRTNFLKISGRHSCTI